MHQKDFDEFRAGILPLAEAGKLGALLFQYPTSFHYSPENIENIEKVLRSFYDYNKVVELRHKSWSEEGAAIKRLLEDYRASEVLIDEPKFATSIRQQPEVIGDVLYFRAHGRNAKKWWHAKESWERYDYLFRGLRLNNMRIGLKLLQARQESKRRSRFTITIQERTRRRTLSCCLRNWELG